MGAYPNIPIVLQFYMEQPQFFFKEIRKKLPVSELKRESGFNFVDPEDIIEELVNSRRLLDMTFFPVLKPEQGQKEAFHSQLFCQSPLLGIQRVRCPGGVVSVGDMIQVHS